MLFDNNFRSRPIFACNKSKSGKWKIACIKNDWKLISQFRDTDIEASDNEHIVSELLNYTKNFYNECVVKEEEEEMRVNNSEIEKRLRELGYI